MPTLAASVLALGALLAVPATAQPPGSAPNNSPAYQGGNGQPGMLPLPPGYRPRTPPPQHQQPQPRPGATAPLPGSGSAGAGKVMYFQKPADALTATGGPGSSGGEVAQLNEPGRGAAPLPVPDVPAVKLPVPPPPPASRYLPAPPGADSAPAATARAPYQPEPPMQPMTTTANKQRLEFPKELEKYIALPSRESIFMVYDDAQLEKAVIDRVIQDLLAANEKKPPGERKTPEEVIKLQDPQTLRFPPMPVVGTPSIPYQPKTARYEPRVLLVEPGYVVHRRLHFEEKNGERAGWDLGPFSTLVAATDFCRNAILWPQSLASGWVHGFWDTSAGKCLPGSPTPYYLYPPGLTLTGSVFEAGAIVGTIAVFP